MTIINAIPGLMKETWSLFEEMAPYLLFGFLVAGVLHVLFPREKIYKYFSGDSFGAIVRASLFGVPLPLCSCGVIPVAAHLKKEGAGNGPVMSFLISTPTTGIDSILATYALLGPVFAFIRPVSAFFAGCLAGTIIRTIGDRSESKKPFPQEECGTCNIQQSPYLTVKYKIKNMMRYAFFDLVGDVGKWLILGIVAGGFISYFIPQNMIENYLGNPLWAYPLMLLIAIPLYVCATGSIPIAASLILKGMTPGAGLVFLIAGPATNTATLSFVGGKMGKKTLMVYLITIIITAVFFGGAVDLFYAHYHFSALSFHHGKEIIPGVMKQLSSIILAGLIFLSFILKWIRAKERLDGKNLSFDVPDMTCEHCRTKITGEIKKLEQVKKVKVDLKSKKVEVLGDVSQESVICAIGNAGYTAKKIKGGKE